MKPISYIKLIESKTNNAHLITFDDNKDYIVKLYKPSENRALMNEWLGYCLARFIGLPIPYAYLVNMPKEFVDSFPNLYDSVYTPIQFASKYLPNCVNAHETVVTNIINHAHLAKIIVFDYWLANTDRTRKNVLLEEKTPGNHYLWILDHAEIFDSYSWTINDLENLPQHLLSSATHKMMAEFIQQEKDFKAALKIIQSIPTQLLEEILSFVPEDWNLSLEEKNEVIKALNYRRYNSLPMIIEKFIKTIYRPLHTN